MPISRSNPHLENNTIIRADNFIHRELQNGGSRSMNVDGSVTSQVFKAVPPAGKYWMIGKMFIYYADTNGFTETTFGNLPALANGVQLKINGTVVENWTDNADVMLSMYDVEGKAIFSKADRSISGVWKFYEIGERHGLQIKSHDDGFAIVIRDDLSSLEAFRAKIQGIEFNDPQI